MKKKVFGLLSLLVCSFFLMANVNARSVYQIGENVLHEGKYSATRFVAGNIVTDKAEVDGLAFVVGSNVSQEGIVPYGFYAGQTVTIKGSIEKDVFAAGQNVIIEKEAAIGRDVYLAGETVTVKANIESDVRITADTIELKGITINGDAKLSAANIVLDKDTVIKGKLLYNEDATVEGVKEASIGKTETYKVDNAGYSLDFHKTFKDIAIDKIVSIISSFIVIALLFVIVPKTKERLNSTELSVGSIVKKSFIGLGLLVATPLVAIIVFAISVATIRIFTFVSLLTLLLYIVAICISYLLAYYVIGHTLVSKAFKIDNAYLGLIVGLVICKLIALIPYIGGLFVFLCIVYGFGLIFSYFKKSEK